jgi:hypothetical protein
VDRGLSMGKEHWRLWFKVSIGYMEYWIGAIMLIRSTPQG